VSDRGGTGVDGLAVGTLPGQSGEGGRESYGS